MQANEIEIRKQNREMKYVQKKIKTKQQYLTNANEFKKC
jgi:hypothetical protein